MCQLQKTTASFARTYEFEDAAVLANADAVLHERAEPATVDVADVVNVQDDLGPALPGQRRNSFAERLITVAEHQPAGELQHRHIFDTALGHFEMVHDFNPYRGETLSTAIAGPTDQAVN